MQRFVSSNYQNILKLIFKFIVSIVGFWYDYIWYFKDFFYFEVRLHGRKKIKTVLKSTVARSMSKTIHYLCCLGLGPEGWPFPSSRGPMDSLSDHTGTWSLNTDQTLSYTVWCYQIITVYAVTSQRIAFTLHPGTKKVFHKQNLQRKCFLLWWFWVLYNNARKIILTI